MPELGNLANASEINCRQLQLCHSFFRLLQLISGHTSSTSLGTVARGWQGRGGWYGQLKQPLNHILPNFSLSKKLINLLLSVWQWQRYVKMEQEKTYAARKLLYEGAKRGRAQIRTHTQTHTDTHAHSPLLRSSKSSALEK